MATLKYFDTVSGTWKYLVVGTKGDKGDPGDTGATGESTFVRAHHGADANFPRPNALYVEWVGSVAPLNATTEDTWVDIT